MFFIEMYDINQEPKGASDVFMFSDPWIIAFPFLIIWNLHWAFLVTTIKILIILINSFYVSTPLRNCKLLIDMGRCYDIGQEGQWDLFKVCRSQAAWHNIIVRIGSI
jgi:hypothetical protein